MANYVSPVSAVYIDKNCYRNNLTITSLNLQYTPWVNNDMSNAFNGCFYASNISAINGNVENMDLAFYNCNSLTSAPTLPANVKSMIDTFYFCQNVTFNAANFPYGVTHIGGAYSTTRIEQAPSIPNTVIYMNSAIGGATTGSIRGATVKQRIIYSQRGRGTFGSCRYITDAPTIPNSVVNMCGAFSCCVNLVNAPVLPNSVTDIYGCFFECEKLETFPVIPNSVLDMSYCFAFTNDTINKHPVIPNSVINYTGMFAGCEWYNIPQTALDLYNTLTPAAKNNSTRLFYGSSIDYANNADLSIIPLTNWDKMFECAVFRNAPPIIPNHVTSLSNAFSSCGQWVSTPALYSNVLETLVIPNSVVNLADTFRNTCLVNGKNLVIPNSVTDMRGTFKASQYLISAPNIPNSVQYMNSSGYQGGTFGWCNKLEGDIYIHSSNIINAYNCFENTTRTKNVYIPFTYTNGVYTSTYNAFIEAGYDTLGTNCGVYLMDLPNEHGISDENYITTFIGMDTSTRIANIAYLNTYIGTSNVVKVPIGMKQG